MDSNVQECDTCTSPAEVLIRFSWRDPSTHAREGEDHARCKKCGEALLLVLPTEGVSEDFRCSVVPLSKEA